MSGLRFDLQSHSVHSDGELPPAQVVENAAAAGVELLALSDHDSVNGVDEALEAGRGQGMRVVPAVELSSIDDGFEDLHVLGYGIDHRDDTLLGRLEAYRADREARADRMAARLRDLGFELNLEPLEARRRAGKTIGRPHLAQAVISHEGNRERLEAEGVDDVSPFIASYLIAGKPGFRGRTMPTVAEAIRTIHDAGGVAVWAHPFWDVDQAQQVLEMVDRYRGDGLDGVEVFYATHTEDQTRLLHEHCTERGLLMTGSADYHGPGHRLFSRFRAFELYGLEPSLGPIAAG